MEGVLFLVYVDSRGCAVVEERRPVGLLWLAPWSTYVCSWVSPVAKDVTLIKYLDLLGSHVEAARDD